jgi:hypothetical protein
MNNNNVNKHIIITVDSCIHIQKSTYNISSLKDKFIAVFNGHNNDVCMLYSHTFNMRGFPASIRSVYRDSVEEYVENLCFSIEVGFLSAIDFDAIMNDDNFYVFLSKDYNDKLELMNL